MHLQPHDTDFGTVQDRMRKGKGVPACVYVCSLRARRMLHAVSLDKAFIWYLTQQDFEAALFNRCTDRSDLTEVLRLEITSFWSKFHESKWLPQSRLLFHVCDLKKLLICINCPKYIIKHPFNELDTPGKPRRARVTFPTVELTTVEQASELLPVTHSG